jgi:heat shock protein HslJ
LSGCGGNGGQSIVTQAPTILPTTVVPFEEATSQPTQDAAAPQTKSAPVGSATGALTDIVGNLSYGGIFPDQKITLTDGYAYYEDSSGRPYIHLIDRMIVTGDLNEDGGEDAAVMLVDYSVGSGDFVYLAVVLDVWGNPAPLEAVMIGDRSPVKSLVMDGSQMVVELIGSGPGDPACCPSWNMRQVFDLVDGKLVQVSSETMEKAALADLSGTSWRLVDLNLDQVSVLPETEITLDIDNGQISGSAGCNTYNGTVTGDENIASAFTVCPLATTRMACDQATMQQEVTFLDLLAKVTNWRYNFGDLGLVYKLDNGDFGELLFAPVTP